MASGVQIENSRGMIASTSRVQQSMEYNLLLLGETGVGKSTFINSFANYLFFPDFEDAKNAKLICPIYSSFSITNADYEEKHVEIGVLDKNEDVSISGRSRTQGCRCYEFKLPYEDLVIKIRLIDTPGVGDTRGQMQDDANFNNILKHLRHYSNLHAICILMKPNAYRMSLTFRYCLKELLRHLHKSAQHNILFFFTNSRSTFYKPGDTLPLLRKLLQELQSTSGITIPLSRDNIFCFDNEAFRFLAAHKYGINFDSSDEREFKQSWSKAVEESARLFGSLLSRPPHNLKNTLSLNQFRCLLLQLAHPFAITLKTNNINVQKLKQYSQEAQKSGQCTKITRKKSKITPCRTPRTVCTIPSCKTSGQLRVCHENCSVRNISQNMTNQKELQSCHIFHFGFDLCLCACGHDWSVHMHTTFEVEYEDVEELLENDQAQQVLASELDESAAEQTIIVTAMAKFANFLVENAILKENDDMKAFIEMQLQEENEKQEFGADNAELIAALQDDLKRYDKEIALIGNSRSGSPYTLEELQGLEQELYGLKHTGKVLANLVQGVRTAADLYLALETKQATTTFTASSINVALMKQFVAAIQRASKK